MHAIAHEGCTDTVRESTLKADSGRKRKKIPCHTGDSNPRQYCGWLLSRTLYYVYLQERRQCKGRALALESQN